MSDRGEYRPIPTVLIDGPNFQELPPNARLTLFILKCKLGPSGLGVIPGMISALSEHTGLDADQVNVALEALVARNWVRTERNVVWVIDGLKYEPSVQRKNANHRKSMESYLNGLPNLAIVAAFRTYYAEWLRGDEDPIPHPMPMGSPMPSLSLKTETEDRILKIKRPLPLGIPADGSGEVSDVPAPVPDKPPPDWAYVFAQDYNHASDGVISPGEVGKQVKPLYAKHPYDLVHSKWLWFVVSNKREYGAAWFRKNFGSLGDPAPKIYSGDLSPDDFKRLSA